MSCTSRRRPAPARPTVPCTVSRPVPPVPGRAAPDLRPAAHHRRPPAGRLRRPGRGAGIRAPPAAAGRPDGHRRADRAVWLGLADAEPGFDAAALARSEKRVIGSFAYSDQEFAEAASLLPGWDLAWASRYPLAAGAQIFTELMDGASDPVKAVLQP